MSNHTTSLKPNKTLWAMHLSTYGLPVGYQQLSDDEVPDKVRRKRATALNKAKHRRDAFIAETRAARIAKIKASRKTDNRTLAQIVADGDLPIPSASYFRRRRS